MKKLNLKELKVKSFITQLDNANNLQGGIYIRRVVGGNSKPVNEDDSGFGTNGQSATEKYTELFCEEGPGTVINC